MFRRLLLLLLWLPVFWAPRLALAAPGDPGWVRLESPYAVLHADERDAHTLRRLSEHAATAIPRLASRLGVPAGDPMTITLAPTDRAFVELQPGHTPDWADGTAWPTRGLIFLHAPSARRGDAPRLEQVLDHEIVHILVGRAFPEDQPPRWLQEGLAQFYAGELGPATAQTLTQAAALGHLLPLRQIAAGFPDDPLGAQLAYAQTADFTAFLAVRAGGGDVGDATLRTLLAAAQRGALLEDAVIAATGETLPVLESEWQRRWGSPWIRIDGLVQTGLPAVLTAGLLVIGFVRRRRAITSGLARLQRIEAWEEAMRVEAARRRAERLVN